MGDVDPKVIKKTQDTLGKIINKPPLTDKLLTKPPFRFLHDIFASVSKRDVSCASFIFCWTYYLFIFFY